MVKEFESQFVADMRALVCEEYECMSISMCLCKCTFERSLVKHVVNHFFPN